MSYPADAIAQVCELDAHGVTQCGIERHTGISRTEVRRILRVDASQAPPEINNRLSTRELQHLLNGMAV